MHRVQGMMKGRKGDPNTSKKNCTAFRNNEGSYPYYELVRDFLSLGYGDMNYHSAQ